MPERKKPEICRQLFRRKQKNAMAALLQSAKLTKEQFQELEEILEQCKEQDKE